MQDRKSVIGFEEVVTPDRHAKKKVLITGAGSYIGEFFYRYAKEHYADNFEIDTLDMKNASWREADFGSYDVVFHVAGIAHADVGHVESGMQKQYYAVNTELAIDTAEKAKADGTGLIVFMSSMIIYGDSAPYGKKKIITADTKPVPVNFYGDSKWEADKGIRSLADRDFKVCVLRLPMVYGEGCKGNYQTMSKLAQMLPVFPDVNNQRSMIYIENLCEFLSQCMLIPKTQFSVSGNIFFPQNTEYVKTADMVHAISQGHNKKLIVTRFLNPAVQILSKLPGACGEMVNKAFGNSCYEKSLSRYDGIVYQRYHVENSLLKTEGIQNGKKALMLASVASMIDQFNMDNIQLLQNMGYKVDVVANFIYGGTISPERVEQLKNNLNRMGVKIYHVPIPREITNIGDIVKSYRMVKQLCNKKRYDLIHCHSPIGGALARSAARKQRKMGTKVIYTAHGFHFYDGAPLKNWLLFYPVEWICSWWTDILITINKEDYKRAKDKFHAKKVVYVPGVGIDTAKFRSGTIDVEKKRVGLGLQNEDIMLLSVGELSIRKNHEIVIRALYEMKNSNVKYFICGRGNLKSYLSNLINDLDMKSQVKLLGYRTDISEICQATDLFVLPSHQEGVSVALMEAIACQIPVVCSKIRGNEDIVSDYLFDENVVEDLTCLLKKIVTSRNGLHEIMNESVKKNYRKIKAYDLSNVSEKMKKLYEVV